MSGRLITFEGTEASGKSTVADAVIGRWAAQGKTVLHVREPGGTPLGEGIRGLLFDYHDNMRIRSELLLFLASRSELVETVIAPALADGQTVLCDRFLDSTLAYQAILGGLPFHEVLGLNDFATGGLYPDLTLTFLTDYATAKRRMEGRPEGGKYDGLDEKGFWQVYEGYLTLAEAYASRTVVLDSSGTRESVEDAAWTVLKERGFA